jgi:hypothetical protein
MRTIEANATVTTERTLIVPLPDDLPLGQHRVVVVIEEKPLPKRMRSWPKMTTYPIGLLDDQMTFQREHLYGDR